jgi:hypothetical protein
VVVILVVIAVIAAAAHKTVSAVYPFIVIGAEVLGGLVGTLAVLGVIWLALRVARTLRARSLDRAQLARRAARGLEPLAPPALSRPERAAIESPRDCAAEYPRVHVITRARASRNGRRY